MDSTRFGLIPSPSEPASSLLSSVILQKVKEKLQSAPEIRIPLVEKILERIKNNDYPISRHAEEAIDIMLNKGIL